MAKTKTETQHYRDRVAKLNTLLIKEVKSHVGKYGDPHIYLHEDEDASFEFETNLFVYCLQETCFLDNMNHEHEYQQLNTEQLAILADYVNNL